MKKHTRRVITGIALAGTVLCAAPLANAATDYDFTTKAYSVLNGETTKTVGNLRFEAAGGKMSWNANTGADPDRTKDPCTLGYACDGDGLGIGDDEITGGAAGQPSQSLKVVFLNGPVRITEVSFLDLFREGNPLYVEVAYWGADGNRDEGALPAVGYTGDNGFGAFGVDIVASSITFNSLSCPVDCTQFDFSLAGMKVEEVPIPAAAWLFGSGLIGLAGVARRRNAA